VTAETYRQVNVSVKIIEFQATKGVDTGLSAYFRQRNLHQYGKVVTGTSAITTADLTFPTATSAGVSVFLDRLNMNNYDLELILQALVDESRALILARPKAMVMVGSDVPTTIQTSQQVPYENTVVVGSTAVQVTAFETTGVTLTVTVPEVVDDDSDPQTQDDAYVRLGVEAQVSEQGQRIVVALDPQLAGTSFASGMSAITVPEFITRRVKTEVWVRNGQVLVLGGLYRNAANRTLTSPPFMQQGEDIVAGLAQRVLPGDITASPISSTLGNRNTTDERRELIFLIKADIWRPAYAVMDQFGFSEEEEERKPIRPTDVITDVIEGITGIPQGIAEGISRESEGGMESDLGPQR
jgi:Flp pilus assembly secretin CpaC